MKDMKSWAQKQTGFTLVELLIVIVVIAILAAISVVAYNGIQQRAIQTKLETTASTVEKKVQLKKVVDGLATPTGNPATAQALRQHYDIASLGDDVSVMTTDLNGNCVVSRSDTCDLDEPTPNPAPDSVVTMMIFPTGSVGNCTSHGGVIIYYGYDEEEEDYKRITIADDPDEGVGRTCPAQL